MRRIAAPVAPAPGFGGSGLPRGSPAPRVPNRRLPVRLHGRAKRPAGVQGVGGDQGEGDYVTPEFPSLSYPNYYSLMTGKKLSVCYITP